ncbi:clotting factor G beta subunit-like isoform X3 [Temnothorax longispinosus]|uniref:clotting factor G beta subunit-like isoform X3 n=1 Tax=Temnothorax longispinosus TaxID=300112 RepID=UPI003A993192
MDSDIGATATLVQQQHQMLDGNHHQGQKKQDQVNDTVASAEGHAVDRFRGEAGCSVKEIAVVAPDNDSVGDSSTQCSDVMDDDNEEEKTDVEESGAGDWIMNPPVSTIVQQHQAFDTTNGYIALPNPDSSNFSNVRVKDSSNVHLVTQWLWTWKRAVLSCVITLILLAIVVPITVHDASVSPENPTPLIEVRGTTGISQERNTNSNNNINNDDCGITGYYTDSINSRIPNGEYALPGQWPWIVQLYIFKTEYEFRCAGSILTNRHIITAASCMKWGVINNHTIPSKKIKVALGPFKYSDGVGTVERQVASYKIHPDYMHTKTRDFDLAIVILKKSVELNRFIKPICLWSGSTTLQNIVGRTGYAVGWTADKQKRLINFKQPRMVRVSIVSQETCLRSRHFITFTSERTFCSDVDAGLLGENGLCFGDIGSGLVLFDNSTGRYQLRGILSRFILQKTTSNWCDLLENYIVYVDVAKYIPWIQQQIF